MKFNTKVRYGIRTMIEIASDSSEKGVFQKDISIRQEISLKYLDHIINALKRSELITTVKGKKSGYILTRKPSEISMLDIYKAFEPGIYVIDCLSQHVKCPRFENCTSRNFWDILNQNVLNYFASTTLENLLTEQNNSHNIENS